MHDKARCWAALGFATRINRSLALAELLSHSAPLAGSARPQAKPRRSNSQQGLSFTTAAGIRSDEPKHMRFCNATLARKCSRRCRAKMCYGLLVCGTPWALSAMPWLRWQPLRPKCVLTKCVSLTMCVMTSPPNRISCSSCACSSRARSVRLRGASGLLARTTSRQRADRTGLGVWGCQANPSPPYPPFSGLGLGLYFKKTQPPPLGVQRGGLGLGVWGSQANPSGQRRAASDLCGLPPRPAHRHLAGLAYWMDAPPVGRSRFPEASGHSLTALEAGGGWHQCPEWRVAHDGAASQVSLHY